MILLHTNILPPDAFEKIVTPFINFIPKFITALIIILVGVFIAKLIAKGIRKVLQKSGVDKLKDKLEEVSFVEKANLQILPSNVISKTFYYIMLLFIALLATTALDVEAVTEIIQGAIEYIPHLLLGIIISVLGILLAEKTKEITHSAAKAVGIPAAGIVSSFVFFFVMVTALMIGFNAANLPVSFLTNNLTLILGGIVVAFGVGYGLASKDMMANYLASFYSKKRFNIGDTISINDISGEIIEIDNSAITVFSDKKRTIIPLNKFTQENVTIHDSV